MKKTWVGKAANVRDVWELNLADGAWGPDDSVHLTIGAKTLSVTIGQRTGDTDVATAVANAWNSGERLDGTDSPYATSNFGGAEFGEFSEMTAEAIGALVRFVAVDSGKPIELYCARGFAEHSTAGAGTGDDITLDNVQPADGKHFWDNELNWEPVGVPVDNDDIELRDSAISIKYGFPSEATAPNLRLNITQYNTFVGRVGLLPTCLDNQQKVYPEYRQQAAYLGDGGLDTSCTWSFGVGAGAGSDLINLAYLGPDGEVTIRCHSMATPTVLPHALNLSVARSDRITVLDGSVNLTAQFGFTKVGITALDVAGGVVSVSGDGTEGGFGCVVTGGIVTALGRSGDEDAWTIYPGGTVMFVDYMAQAEIGLEGGKMVWNSGSSGIASLQIANGGVADFEQDLRPINVGGTAMWQGGSILDAFGRVTWTGDINLSQCDVSDVTLRLGKSRTLAISFG